MEKNDMKTLRELIEKKIYDHLEHFVSLADAGGENTEMFGIRVFDESEKFVQGAMVKATVTLYVHYLKTGDNRADMALERVRRAVKIAISDRIKTWGKLSVLRAMCQLHKAGLMDVICQEDMEELKRRTDYEDFFDKEKMQVINLPTNYLQVAMACAGYRELIGWDTEPMCEKIRDRLLEIIEASSTSGYMDEDPPMARFDRYSILVSSEMADTLNDLGMEVPVSVLSNISDAMKISCAMANEKGDGINYGRSLSCHGDGATLEILSTAFANGLVPGKDKDVALLYSIRITEKILSFWYDEERKSFNIWWDGRSTNRYRQVKRVLEVNLDMANHMLTTLANFEKAGLADELPAIDRLPCPEGWVATEMNFLDAGERVAKTVVLRRKNTLAMLPLVGLGNRYRDSSYMPYPAICGVLESAPEGRYPFLVPEYTTDDGRILRPLQFYSSVNTSEENGIVTVVARGKLALYGEKQPAASEYQFVSEYVFDGDTITANFDTDLIYEKASMLVGTRGDSATISTFGFDECKEEQVEGEYDFMTPSGAIQRAVTHIAKSVSRLSYRVSLE